MLGEVAQEGNERDAVLLLERRDRKLDAELVPVPVHRARVDARVDDLSDAGQAIPRQPATVGAAVIARG